MKKNKPNYCFNILFILVILVNSGCKKECTTKDTFVDNKLTPEIIAFYRYDSFDTILCKIENQPSINIQSEEKEDGISIYKEYLNYDCGTGIVYNNHYRVVNYFDNANKLILRTYIEINKNKFLSIDFNFYNTTIDENYEISMPSNGIPDTSTIDGNFYTDIYSTFEPSRNYKLYYSKSTGLIKIISNGETIFQLIK